MDYAKPRRIVTMTPNKHILWPISLWPIWLWPILIFCVADMFFFCCGRYRLAVADMVVADMVCGWYGRTPYRLTKREDCHYQTVFFKYLKSFYTNGSDRKQSVFRYKVSGSSNTVLDDTSGTQFTNSLWDYRDGAHSSAPFTAQNWPRLYAAPTS